MNRSIAQIVRIHLDAIAKRDAAAVAANFAEDAVVLAPGGPIRGRAAIRADIEGFFAEIDAEFDAAFKVLRLDAVGDVAYLNWQAPPQYPFVSETFVVRDGQIVVQTYAAFFP